jgi:hypothetical protein
MKPDISIAPQNDTSPSPCEKCISPIDKLSPSTKTGKYTVHPCYKFLISQLHTILAVGDSLCCVM